MLNEWLETAKYDVDESYDGFYLETEDWSLLLYLTGCSTKNELINEMSEDYTWSTERGPWYVEGSIDNHHIIAHNWYGAKWWGILIEPA